MAWQDGTIKQGLDLMSLFPISDPPDHGFLAGQYLLEKGPIGKRRLGMVKSVNAKDQTACVQWVPVPFGDDCRNLEVVSVYKIVEHPDFDFRYGDVVFKFVPGQFSDLSWVGIITALRDGDIEVTWANGMISTVSILQAS